MPVFSIQNLGCAKNQVDAEVIAVYLEQAGWEAYRGSGSVDVILVNTCGFIREAKEESVETVMDMIVNYPDSSVVICGCLSQRYGEDLAREIPEAAGIFGNGDLSQIAPFLEVVLSRRGTALKPVVSIPPIPRNYSLPCRRNPEGFPGTAYVKIAEGCSNNCSYCAIPLIRGGVRSREPEEVISEISGLINNGYKEIILIAQDAASYGLESSSRSLIRLLRKILGLKKDFWLRLLYIHPDRFPPEIIDFAAEDPRLLPYFDIPFQHASKKVLESMGRTGSSDDYLRLIDSIRTKLPDSIIRSTFMTGYPGEGQTEFEDLLLFQEQARLEWLGVFTYSPEEDTPAFRQHKGRKKVSAKKAMERKKILMDRQEPITSSAMDRFVGRILDIILEEKIEEEALWIGRGFLQAPEVDGASVIHSSRGRPGDLVKARIIKNNGFDLEGVSV
ncbi:MAG: 30S ribosomal protein S12 methylthiotransferase RimO [Spirochaetia bacterium]